MFLCLSCKFPERHSKHVIHKTSTAIMEVCIVNQTNYNVRYERKDQDK